MAEVSTHALKLAGKISIVIGGASGIGEATTRLFASNGAFVVIADIQDELGKKVSNSIGLQHCMYFHCVISSEDDVISLINFTIEKYSCLDITFSNAGIKESSHTMYPVTTAACVKHAARAMVNHHVKGSIICTTSVVASKGASMQTDYVMSKHAVLGLVRSASKQLGVYGIRVNCVSPSAVVTGISSMSPEEIEKTKKVCEGLSSLKGARLSVEDVAEAVVFLASDGSKFVSGHELVVDGGLTKLPDEDDLKMYNC
ncbi:(-)-isopiperitenol/(-)-carveol dehydrogenase [Artemisia annua]|uniref:(-)-isopiperitenol/(-)-carveol dehydrogenase n=1 Tax=Artemisia annua TaxID=35608 RepID=A0A2U1KXL5_ARTAN|nr:(-)-isopiperitenol/(-)-carveol dehydrogenase [Artemisia annua]